MIQNSTQAFPLIERNTFLTVYLDENEAPPRRCSSLPARLRDRTESCGADVKDKASDGFDSEAITDVCTEASDEPTSFSESADGDASSPGIVFGDFTENDATFVENVATLQSMSALALPWVPVPPKTRLSSKAACWDPTASEAKESPVMWRVGAPKNSKWLEWWQETAADIVAKMSCTLGELECISRVESRREGADWIVTARSSSVAMCQFERIQTAAKQSLLQAAEASECIYVLGHRWSPFQQTPMGFFASLGSMRTTKKACWDVYNNGVCPRGCSCPWEHPAFVNTVNVIIDFTEEST